MLVWEFLHTSPTLPFFMLKPGYLPAMNFRASDGYMYSDPEMFPISHLPLLLTSSYIFFNLNPTCSTLATTNSDAPPNIVTPQNICR